MRPAFFRDPAAVAVVIVANNVEADIGRCIKSVLAASDHCGSQGTLWIVVVAHACTDRTAPLARRAIGPFGEVLQSDVQSAAAAGALGEAAGLAHFGEIHPAQTHSVPVCIAHTDGRTQVGRDWLNDLLGRYYAGVTGGGRGARELALGMQ